MHILQAFRAPTYWRIVQNIRQAEQIALRFWKLGYAVICPHLNTANFDGAIPKERDSVWLEGDKEIMLRCDVVVAMPTWEKSSGAKAEIALAQARGMEIIFEKDSSQEEGLSEKP